MTPRTLKLTCEAQNTFPLALVQTEREIQMQPLCKCGLLPRHAWPWLLACRMIVPLVASLTLGPSFGSLSCSGGYQFPSELKMLTPCFTPSDVSLPDFSCSAFPVSQVCLRSVPGAHVSSYRFPQLPVLTQLLVWSLEAWLWSPFLAVLGLQAPSFLNTGYHNPY